MSSARMPFLGASPETIAAALCAALAEVAPGSVARVGDEHDGLRNVAVDPGPTPGGISSSLFLDRAHRALEAAGVKMAPHALAPQVPGRIRGSVWTAPHASSSSPNTDLAHLTPAPQA